MDKIAVLHKLINGTATKEEINQLKQALVGGEISIGGNVNRSVVVTGSGNTIQISPQALEHLGGSRLLGNLKRDLKGEEIAQGLARLESELPARAPVLLPRLKKQTRQLSPFLKVKTEMLSDQARKERIEALAVINSLCLEVLDISFNAICLGEELPEYDSRSPFLGLESFRPEDSEFFFGREALTEKLVTKINVYPFLAVLGASGSGKSSLVMAGLLPALDTGYFIFRPGNQPTEALIEAKKHDIIIVDQFEEVFTLIHDEHLRKIFIDQLLEATKHHSIIITLRSDFLGEVAQYRALNEQVQNHLENVPPMDMDELHDAVKAQANQVGLRFDADLSQQILDEVEGEPGAMPLLQHALWELWKRRHGRWLRTQEYRNFGGVKRAIASTAEQVYAACDKKERGYIHDIFFRLTQVDESEEKRDTRKRVSLHDFVPADHTPELPTYLLDKLANARLIVKTVEKDTIHIEIAHEELIRHWERLKNWIDEGREKAKKWGEVSYAAHQWDNKNRDIGLVNFRDPRLRKILTDDEKPIYSLNSIEKAYLDACVREKATYNRKSKLYKIFTMIAVISLVIIFGFVISFVRSYAKQRPTQGEWIQIPAGIFVEGMSEGERAMAYALCQEGALDKTQCTSLEGLIMESGEQLDAWLPEFLIMDNEVTNAQYQQCVDGSSCEPPKGWEYSENEFDFPATNLNWYQAGAYCKWLGGRLPTEGEWEKAARGPDDYIFPWGNDWDPLKTNLEHFKSGSVQTILEFASSDVNSYGIKNMAGNVREWTASEGMPVFPDQIFENFVFTHEDNNQDWPVIVRGGSWKLERSQGMTAKRGADGLLNRTDDLGFRCVCPEGQECKSPWSWKWVWFEKH